ncbi:hypothetical protein F4677DRAFT_414009 [Hypoxylon crocopeplum]|nr:hypothetical protein F4677DRAFT_414009 [Hypoxylon crocopeplum]
MHFKNLNGSYFGATSTTSYLPSRRYAFNIRGFSAETRIIARQRRVITSKRTTLLPTRESHKRSEKTLPFSSYPSSAKDPVNLQNSYERPEMAGTPTVFVTSATGSQGSALCNELLKIGWNVRATTRDLGTPSAQALRAAGVHLTVASSWDDEDALRKGIEGCDKLYLCLYPNLEDFQQLPRQAALITRLAKEAGVTQAISSTTLGSFMIEEGLEPPVTLGPLFDAHVHCKKRVEQNVIDGGFDHWTILRPCFFMANFLEPKIQFGYTETKRGSWTNSLTAETLLGLIDHVDIARFAVAAFQDPTTYHGRKLGLISEELLVQEAMDQLAEAVGDGRSIKAIFMTDEEIAKAQAEGSWLVFASETCVRYMSDYTDLDELHRLLPKLTTFREFLERENEAVKETYLS